MSAPSDPQDPKGWEVGWFPDPDLPGQERFWNGSAWTRTRPAQPDEPTEVDPEADRVRLAWILVGATAVVVVVFIVVAVIFFDGDSLTDEDDQAEFDEVTLTSCDPPGTLQPQLVEGIVENRSSEPSDYAIDVSVVASDGTRIGTGSTRVEAVEPGQTAAWSSETDTSSDNWDEGSSCAVTSVERTRS